MKKVKVIFDKWGKLGTVDNPNVFFEGEKNSLEIQATFPENYTFNNLNVYMRTNSGSQIFKQITSETNVFAFVVENEILEKGILKIGFEGQMEDKIIRFYPVTLNIDGYISDDFIIANKLYTTTVDVDECVTGEAGSSAKVENVGNSKNVKLKFTLPKGDKGDKGDKGAQSVSYVICSSDTPNNEGCIVATDTLVQTLKNLIDDNSFVSGTEIIIRKGTYLSSADNLEINKPCKISFESDVYITCMNAYLKAPDICIENIKAENMYIRGVNCTVKNSSVNNIYAEFSGAKIIDNLCENIFFEFNIKDCFVFGNRKISDKLNFTDYFYKNGMEIYPEVFDENNIEVAKNSDMATKNELNILTENFGIKHTVYGNPAVATGVVPFEHSIDISVSSENIIPFPYYHDSRTINGVTFTVNADGSVTVNGTATANTTFVLYKKQNGFPLGFDKNAVYVQSVANDVANVSLVCNRYKEGSTNYTSWIKSSTGCAEVPEDTTGIYIYLNVPNGKTVDGSVFPKLQIGTQATAYTPYVEVAGKEVTLPDGTLEIVNEDGKVTGVKSISPSMTVESLTADTLVSLTYKTDTKTYVDMKIKEFTQSAEV